MPSSARHAAFLRELEEAYEEGNPHVVLSVRCEECGGAGVIQHWLYDEFYKAWASGEQSRPLDDALIEFFSDHGYSRDEIPPEEEDCDACGGTGEVERKVPLAEFFAPLLGFIEEAANAS